MRMSAESKFVLAVLVGWAGTTFWYAMMGEVLLDMQRQMLDARVEMWLSLYDVEPRQLPDS